ncbi:Glutathione S-transferase S1 [Entomortierella beljakovae]|nr:Glutathione S-transferase S1 [Entomortierella beljakovae]
MTLPDATHFSRESTQESAAVLRNPDSFKLLYWPIGGSGATSRDILSFGQAKAEYLFPENWPEDKLATPFHVVPVLFIKSKEGEEVVLSESSVVEQYLAKTFGLLGDNEYEEYIIKAFHSSTTALQGSLSLGVTWTAPENKAKGLANFLNDTLAKWIRTHEKHLADNGNNGYYVGNKLSLADIRTANMIEHLALIPEAAEIMGVVNKSEAIMKVQQSVRDHPNIAKWRSTEAYNKLAKTSAAFYKDPSVLTKPRV